jgi:hypothetical protein
MLFLSHTLQVFRRREVLKLCMTDTFNKINVGIYIVSCAKECNKTSSNHNYSNTLQYIYSCEL